MSTIQILSKETLSKKKYALQYVSFEKPDETGEFHNLQKEVYFRPDTVAVLLADKPQRKILLTKQFRLPAFLNGSDSGYLVEVCAGVIDENETPEQTVLREVEEETGYQAFDIEKIGGCYTTPSGVTEFMHFFTAGYKSEKGHAAYWGLKAEGERIELVEIDFEEARQLLTSGAVRDLKTLALLQHFFINEK
jgi:nudix-type nucleoside diphosphatase (YffH/AdpP family)